MILILVIAAGCYVIFAALPALLLLLYLNRHRSPVDFDTDPSVMSGTQYEAFSDEILIDIKKFKKASWETATIKAPDNITLSGLFHHSGSRTAILLHGYSSTPFNNFPSLGISLIENGWSVLLPFMRGHGPSGGRTTFGIKEANDALLWAEWAEKTHPQSEIIVYGMSMGGACINYASDANWPGNVKALIVDSGYYRVKDQMYSMPQMNSFIGILLIPLIGFYSKLLFGSDISSDARKPLASAKLPMCFIEGTADRSVPPESVEKAYFACGSEKTLLKAAGAAHTLAFLTGGENLLTGLFGFIDRYTNNGGE